MIDAHVIEALQENDVCLATIVNKGIISSKGHVYYRVEFISVRAKGGNYVGIMDISCVAYAFLLQLRLWNYAHTILLFLVVEGLTMDWGGNDWLFVRRGRFLSGAQCLCNQWASLKYAFASCVRHDQCLYLLRSKQGLSKIYGSVKDIGLAGTGMGL
ncbi:hypothetical protein ACJX0J_040451, partial [Zea mays]